MVKTPDLVEKLLESGNKVLEAAGNDMKMWSSFKHVKRDLEVFLAHNLVHLKFKPKNAAVMKEIVCTSSTPFIRAFSLLKEQDKRKAFRAKNLGIKTKDPCTVMTYNVLDGEYNTIALDLWEIVNFISITPENIEVLDKVANDLLKRAMKNDKLTQEKSKDT